MVVRAWYLVPRNLDPTYGASALQELESQPVPSCVFLVMWEGCEDLVPETLFQTRIEIHAIDPQLRACMSARSLQAGFRRKSSYVTCEGTGFVRDPLTEPVRGRFEAETSLPTRTHLASSRKIHLVGFRCKSTQTRLCSCLLALLTV